MRNRSAYWVLPVLCLVSSVAVTQEIPNWAAPPYWEPAARVSAQGESGDHIRGTLTTSSPVPFYPVTPCRLMDTRGLGQTGAFGPPTLAANATRDVPIPTHPVCTGIPVTAEAYSLNITVTNTGASPFGFIKIWPTGALEPNVSTLNWSSAGQTIANAAVVQAGTSGTITVRSGNASADVIIDINGYYAAGPVGLNTALGDSALFSTTTGQLNTGIGGLALLLETSGSFNTAVGALALEIATTASGNTAIGFNALGGVTGSNNTALGMSSGSSISTGTSNVLIGVSAGSNITSGSNNILIGSAGFNNESNTIRIGDNANQSGAIIAGIAGQTAVGGVPVLVTGGGRLGTTTSSRRFKTDIRDMGGESDGLMKLRPVVFRYKEEIDPTSLTQYGLIAEEVADVYPALVANGADGKPEAIRYQEMNALLLNELQKQRRFADAQQCEVERQKEVIDRLQARLGEIEKRLQ